MFSPWQGVTQSFYRPPAAVDRRMWRSRRIRLWTLYFTIWEKLIFLLILLQSVNMSWGAAESSARKIQPSPRHPASYPSPSVFRTFLESLPRSSPSTGWTPAPLEVSHVRGVFGVKLFQSYYQITLLFYYYSSIPFTLNSHLCSFGLIKPNDLALG